MSNTKIGTLLEGFDLHEAKQAGRNERRKFWKVTFPDVREETIVEAPSKGRAIMNAILMMRNTMSMAQGIAYNNRDRAKAELISTFTPSEVPFLTKDTVEGTTVEPWLFDDAVKEMKRHTRRVGKYNYAMAQIPVTHPKTTENSWSMLPAYMLPEYIEKGYVVMGKTAAQRRIGTSDEPYLFGDDD